MNVKKPVSAAAIMIASLAPATLYAQDAAKVSPKTTSTVFENDQVRVIRSYFAPGASEPVHTHPAGFYYVSHGGALKVTGADGKVEMWTPKSGETEWSDGEAPHSAVNVGKAPLEYFLVEVKSAPTAYPNR